MSDETPTKPSMFNPVDRRTIKRDQTGSFHPDQVREAANALVFYGGQLGPMGEDAMRRALEFAALWQDRQAREERSHERNRGQHELEMRTTMFRENLNRIRELDDAGEEYLRSAAAADTHSADVDPGRVDPWSDR